MWWVAQWILPSNPIGLWMFWGGAWFWIALITWHPYAVRQIPGMIMWTDILNMVTVHLFNLPPTWWWAHGATITLLPYIGQFWICAVVWVVCLVFFGPTLFHVGLNIY